MRLKKSELEEEIIMPYKGKRPKCICGHADSKHRANAFDKDNIVTDRGRCKVVECNCKHFEARGWEDEQ